MEFLKALFSNGPLTFEQLEAAVKEQKMNIVNLADGGYISKRKSRKEHRRESRLWYCPAAASPLPARSIPFRSL